MKKFVLASASAAAAIASLVSWPAFASDSYSGTVTGYFDLPQLQGSVVATNGVNRFYDNTGTAFYGFVPDGAGANTTIFWGANPGSSFLTFTGADFQNVAPDTPFKLGSLNYHNDTSALDSVLFGATLNLNLGSGIDPKVSLVSFVTTENTGLSAARDSDFVGFGGFPLTFNIYEGSTAVADLYGMIVGDPYVELTNLKIAPGFEQQGFIGAGIGGVPEPSTWAMFLFGLGAIGVALRSRRLWAKAAEGKRSNALQSPHGT